MALIYAARVKETTTTTGTGTVNLDGAVTGFQTFVSGIGDGNECYYTITDGTDWEVGRGTVTSGSPDTLSRDTIEDSSNGGSAVNFSAGSKDVFCTNPPVNVAKGVRCLVKRSAIGILSNNVHTDLTWGSGTEVFDEDGWHSEVTNTERFTVPAAHVGRRVRVVAGVEFGVNANGRRGVQIELRDSGGSVVEKFRVFTQASPTSGTSLECSGIVIPSSGDYIVVQGIQSSGTNVGVSEVDNTFCYIELV